MKMDKGISMDYRCPICEVAGRHNPIAIFASGHRAIKCKSCETAGVYPMPTADELAEYYKDYEITKGSDYSDTRLVEYHDKIFNYLLSRIGNKRDTTFLDYGFGTGAFLKFVAKKGFSASGVELSIQNCEQLKGYCIKNNIKVDIINSLYEPLERLSNRPFDCVTLFSVIEHVLDPVGVLISLSALQSRGGLLYIECPNNDALYLKVKNIIRKHVDREDFFDSLNPLHHLYGFNKRSMNILLKRAGYEPLEIGDYAFADGLHQVETAFWYPSPGMLLHDRNRHNFYNMAKFLIKLFDPLASRLLGAGGGLYAMARKTS